MIATHYSFVHYQTRLANDQAAELSTDPRISVIPVRVSAKKNHFRG
jgi:hypothetical protein